MTDERAFDLDEKARIAKEKKDIKRTTAQALIAAKAGVPIKYVRLTRKLGILKGAALAAAKARAALLEAEVAALEQKRAELIGLRGRINRQGYKATIMWSGYGHIHLYAQGHSFEDLTKEVQKLRDIGRFINKER